MADSYRLNRIQIAQPEPIWQKASAHEWNPVILANFRRLRLPPPPWTQADSDHYRDAPDSVRRQHSLHILAPTGDAWDELTESLRARGALIVLFTDKPRDELVKGLKLYLAWYASPSTLKTQLEQGSDHVRRGLMTGVKALLLQTSPKDDYVIYLAPGVTWPVPPEAPDKMAPALPS